MKTRDLLKKLKVLAAANKVTFEFEEHGARHDKYRFNEKLIPIPRHNEIGEGLVTTIIKQCESALPEGDDE